MPQQPSVQTIKRLFAESGNICAFPNCTQTIVNGASVQGEVCHIKGNRPGSPRYDKSQSDKDRHGYDNLVLMCGTHHTVIDSDEKSYSVERLHEIKSDHIRSAAEVPDDEAEKGAQLIFSSPTLSLNQTSGITGSANASSGNIHFAPIIQVGNVGLPSAPPSSPTDVASVREGAANREIPRLQLTFAQGSATLEDSRLSFSNAGDYCISIRVYNKPADDITPTLVARQIVASIHLESGSRVASVESSCWIGHDANQIDLRPGAHAQALLAFPCRDALTMYENLNPFSRENLEWNSPFSEPERVPFPIGNACHCYGRCSRNFKGKSPDAHDVGAWKIHYHDRR